MQDKTISLTLNLRLLTPLHIGDNKGKKLSPYCDYVFSDDGRYLHYLDLEKIEVAVVEKNALDDYVQLIQAMDNNRSQMDLKRFLTDRLGLDIDWITRSRIAQTGLDSKQKQPVMPVVKNAGRPYLPGSSLKGALRTAMLYDWLVFTKAGKDVIESYRNPINEAAEKYQRHLHNDLLSSNWRQKEERIRNLREEVNNSVKTVFEEEALWGQSQAEDKAPEAQYIRVRDSRPVDVKQLKIYALKRIRIVPGRGKNAIPQVVEAIQPGTELYTDISIRPEFQNTYFDYLKTGDFATIFGNLNNFSKDCIDNELCELEDALNSKGNTSFKREIEKLLEFYENLKNRANSGAIFLRLGFGKTVNDNSLILALLYGMEDDDAWHKFRQVVHNIRRKEDFFPVTRTITADGLPLGWVEVAASSK